MLILPTFLIYVFAFNLILGKPVLETEVIDPLVNELPHNIKGLNPESQTIRPDLQNSHLTLPRLTDQHITINPSIPNPEEIINWNDFKANGFKSFDLWSGAENTFFAPIKWDQGVLDAFSSKTTSNDAIINKMQQLTANQLKSSDFKAIVEKSPNQFLKSAYEAFSKIADAGIVPKKSLAETMNKPSDNVINFFKNLMKAPLDYIGQAYVKLKQLISDCLGYLWTLTRESNAVNIPDGTSNVQSGAKSVNIPDGTSNVQSGVKPVNIPDGTSNVQSGVKPVNIPDGTSNVQSGVKSVDTLEELVTKQTYSIKKLSNDEFLALKTSQLDDISKASGDEKTQKQVDYMVQTFAEWQLRKDMADVSQLFEVSVKNLPLTGPFNNKEDLINSFFSDIRTYQRFQDTQDSVLKTVGSKSILKAKEDTLAQLKSVPNSDTTKENILKEVYIFETLFELRNSDPSSAKTLEANIRSLYAVTSPTDIVADFSFLYEQIRSQADAFFPFPVDTPINYQRNERLKLLDALDLGGGIASKTGFPKFISKQLDALDLVGLDKKTILANPEKLVTLKPTDISNKYKGDLAYANANPELQKAASLYSGDLYGPMHQRLKDRSSLPSVGDKSKIVSNILTNNELDKYILDANNLVLNGPTLKGTYVVYRKIGYASTHPEGEVLKYLNVGDVLPVKGLTSTSRIRSTAADAVILKIVLPPNFPAFHIEGFSDFPIEAEVLLPYTLDKTGQSLNYGFKILNVDQAAVVTGKKPQFVVTVFPELLEKPIPLNQ